MNQSSIIMICNNSGPVAASLAGQWRIADVDWNSNRIGWSAARPMNTEEDMLANLQAFRAVNPNSIGWLYRNGIKALPWFTSVRKRLEDPAYWGWFMPLANCSTAGGPPYLCGPNATNNLFHDYEQTPPRTGDCGVGVECGEYVFNHRNDSILIDFFLDEYFFGPTALGAPDGVVRGFYVDDDWSSAGPSEMDKDAVQKMGMSKADVQAMIKAWAFNQQAWRDAVEDAGGYEWYFLFGGQQSAPGMNQTDPASTCTSYLRSMEGADAPAQVNSTLFYGFSRVTHQEAWLPDGSLPYGEQDYALFLLSRGPYAFLGYGEDHLARPASSRRQRRRRSSPRPPLAAPPPPPPTPTRAGWTGCADSKHPFTRPAFMDDDFGAPTDFVVETAPGSQVFTRHYERATVTMDCNTFTPTITPV
jgi:hypothetical protein